MNNPNVFRADSNAPQYASDADAAEWLNNWFKGNSRNIGKAATTEVSKQDLDDKEDASKGKFRKGKERLIRAGVAGLASLATLIFIETADKITGANDNRDDEYQESTTGAEAFAGHDKALEDQGVDTEALFGAGESEKLTVSYDYSDWSDFDKKTSVNNYGTDRSDCYGNDDKTREEWMKTAEDMPEALASYRHMFFEDEEKELGIDGMDDKQLEDFLSETDNPEAAKLQKRMLEKLNQVIYDKENTKFEYYLENDTEVSCFVVWQDSNADGKQTPEEMHLGQSRVARSNAKQFDCLRRENANANWEKKQDINLDCRFQPNMEEPSPDLPFIDPNDPNTPVYPPDDPPEWGKEGTEAHAGNDVEFSDRVGDSKETSNNIGNQGHVDDNGATPGSSSEDNGSTIVAPGATGGDRLSGGESQGGGEMAGDNAYYDTEQISTGTTFDAGGDGAQQAAQSGATPGGDNYSNAAEEEAVRNGGF